MKYLVESEFNSKLRCLLFNKACKGNLIRDGKLQLRGPQMEVIGTAGPKNGFNNTRIDQFDFAVDGIPFK